MPGEVSCAEYGIEEHVNTQKAMDLGWLGQDGICRFPEGFAAIPAGFTSGLPINFFAIATKDQLKTAILKGWILFKDGEGESMTFAKYIEKYPNYPDPLFILFLQGRWPPRTDRFIKLGRHR